MKALTLALASTLLLTPVAIAAEGSGTSRSGTANSTGANDAGSGASPGAQGKGHDAR